VHAGNTAAAHAAGSAFSSGLDLAMIVGAACARAAAGVVAWKMPRHSGGPRRDAETQAHTRLDSQSV
jgi:hypothetical protein